MAHLPTFLKLGLCQGLMHQKELGMNSGYGRWCRELAWGTPHPRSMSPGPTGEVSKQWDLLCVLPVLPLLEKLLQS